MGSRIVPQRGFNLDFLMWLFTRISGLALILLALIGAAVALYWGARTQMDLGTLVRWMFFPNPNHVINSEIIEIDNWASAYWQIMEMLFFFFAGTHAANGLRMIAEDYISRSFGQILLRGLFFLLWLFFLATAVYVILAG